MLSRKRASSGTQSVAAGFWPIERVFVPETRQKKGREQAREGHSADR
jgi:hypothetical protein